MQVKTYEQVWYITEQQHKPRLGNYCLSERRLYDEAFHPVTPPYHIIQPGIDNLGKKALVSLGVGFALYLLGRVAVWIYYALSGM